MELDFNALRELLAAINQTDVAEFTLRNGDFELIVRKGSPVAPASLSPTVGEAAPPVSIAPPIPVAAPVTVANSVSSAPTNPLANERLVDITSPMVGTFYRAPAPDEAPYVDVGDRIRTGQVICIIEAMKLMNEVESEVSGEIVEILVENGQPVEYGQVLMRVDPR